MSSIHHEVAGDRPGGPLNVSGSPIYPFAVGTTYGPVQPAPEAVLPADVVEALRAGGVKFDQDKPRYDLLPPELLDGVARVLTFGAKKYAPRNWEKGMAWGRVFGALMRHLWAWWRGEKLDPETGMSHLWHAGCCLGFLIAYEARGVGQDDRPGEVTDAHHPQAEEAAGPAA